jgi:hypothetical protein
MQVSFPRAFIGILTACSRDIFLIIVVSRRRLAEGGSFGGTKRHVLLLFGLRLFIRATRAAQEEIAGGGCLLTLKVLLSAPGGVPLYRYALLLSGS